jgi:hypothetical protein
MPFSNGLDSRAVAGLMAREMGNRLVRVRLGLKLPDGKALAHERQAFTTVPYKVRAGNDAFVESTARSRGFKFALISGIASYLAHAGQVIVPESGQGALGPTLVTVGQAYEDYRSHPLFTGRMEKFVEALLGHRVRYVFHSSGTPRAKRCGGLSRNAAMRPGLRPGRAGGRPAMSAWTARSGSAAFAPRACSGG